MMRWIATFATLVLLTGCVYTQEVVYREPYRSTPYYEPGYSPDVHQGEGTYYSPSYAGAGSYYYGSSNYGASYYGSSYYSPSFGVSYFDYPFYYSVFWPVNRWYYDPFAYPGYYYGVTWFPRSYMSLSLGYYGSWRGYGWLAYSPYRYSWVDSYYDWRPWYNRYPSYSHYYPTPRYGDARVEASRLADMRRPARPRNGRPNSTAYGQSQSLRNGANAPAYRGNRAADYGRAGAANTPRQGVMQDGVRRVEAGVPRSMPSTGAFGNPIRANDTPRQILPQRSASGNPARPTSAMRNELQQATGQRDAIPSRSTNPGGSTLIERQRNDVRGYALPGSAPSTPAPRNSAIQNRAVGARIDAPDRRAAGSSAAVPGRGNAPAPVTRMESGGLRVAPTQQPSSVQSPGNRGWSSGSQAAPPSYQAPAPRAPVVAPSTPSRVGSPSRSTTPSSSSSTSNSRSASSSGHSNSSRSSSSSKDSSSVRRVGSSRNR